MIVLEEVKKYLDKFTKAKEINMKFSSKMDNLVC